jgi:hypothetical protein
MNDKYTGICNTTKEIYLFSVLVTCVDDKTSRQSMLLFQLLIKELFYLLIPFVFGKYIWTWQSKH